MKFTSPDSVDVSKVFLTRKSSVNNRWDPFYLRPEIVALEEKVRNVTSHRLRDFVIRMAGGATPSTKQAEIHYTEGADGIPFIRVQNLSTTGRLNLEDCKHITRSTHEGLLARSRLKGGELLVKITGVGRMAVASVVPDGFEGNINQHIVAIRTKDTETSETLAAYLNLDIAERLASRRSTGGTRPALDYPALLSIPIIFDRRIPELMDVAINKYYDQRSQADALLAHIDNILFNELSIEFPPQMASTIESRIFRCTLSTMTGRRLDPAYFETRFSVLLDALRRSPFQLIPLGHVCSLLSSGKTPARDEYSESPTPYPIIKVASYSGDSVDLTKADFASHQQPYTARKGDIFVLSAAHQPNYVGRFVKQLTEEPRLPTSFVGELICVRADPYLIDADYLFALFSSSVFQILLNREKRGQTSHIYPDDIRKILIPLPPLEEQRRIAHRIRQIRAEAKMLRKQASIELEEVRKDIEAMILGERRLS